MVIVEAKDLWEYCEEHKNSINSTMYEVANNDEYGVVIYLTSNESEDPCLIVEVDDEAVYEIDFNKVTAECVAMSVYNTYLTENVKSALIEIAQESEESYLDRCDEIDDRELALEVAVEDFITVALGDGCCLNENNAESIIEDCKEHFCEYLARKHGLLVYRPMFLEDDSGEEFYEEYPYGCLEFEDDGNPIYK